MNRFLQKVQGDRTIWVCVLLLSLISILAVYTTTSPLALRYQGGNTEYYVLKHILLTVVGIGIMYFIHKLDYRFFAKISKLLLFVSIILLAFTINQGEDAEINSAKRWLSVLGFSFQPSDLAKFSIIVHLALVLTRKQEIIKDFKKGFVPVIGVVLLVCGLIAPANLSTALLIFTCCIYLMYTSGIKGRYIGGMLLAGAIAFNILVYTIPPEILPRVTTWKHRMEAWTCRVQSAIFGGDCATNPEQERSLYQTNQACIAIAAGGVTGMGPGRSVQRNYLPHPYSDFIYAIIIEEYGLLGGLLVLALYLVIFIRAAAIVTVSKTFGALLASGLAFLIISQALINMGVTVGILPVTGLPLPMVSMGGTSILFTCLSFGVILSVSREAVGSVRNLRPGGRLKTEKLNLANA